MEAVSELSYILSHYFSWNKSRLSCLFQIIIAMIRVETVSLTSMATVFQGDALVDSHYKRLQRFINWLGRFQEAAQMVLYTMTLQILGLNKVPLLYLAMDRTNWKLGKTDINPLVLGVRYHRVNIPLAWLSLRKPGASSTEQRISLISRFIKMHKSRDFVLTADREFVGREWLQYLQNQKIPFVIRIKSNIQVYRPKCRHSVPTGQIFKRLRRKRKIAL